jgi:ABC-type polysaccharide/polyol phosphate transport system ATPase subunit
MTAASSSSSEGSAAAPVIELRGVGLWFRMHQRARRSLRQMLTGKERESALRTKWALRDVDLVCHEGESWGIVGHNGAGKSTLCHVLANILTPDEGTAEVRGKVSALVKLGAGISPEQTGRENVLLYASFLGISRELIQERMGDIAEFSELGEALDEPVRTYSTGMRARLGFSVATALDPEVLILDEVLAVGDRGFKKKSRARMEELMGRSKCILTVTHSMSFVKNATTHCLWLDKGSVRMAGLTTEVLPAYEESTNAAEA